MTSPTRPSASSADIERMKRQGRRDTVEELVVRRALSRRDLRYQFQAARLSGLQRVD